MQTLSGGTADRQRHASSIPAAPFAERQAGGLVDIAGGAVVSGGLLEVGSGTVDVLESGGTANVAFLRDRERRAW